MNILKRSVYLACMVSMFILDIILLIMLWVDPINPFIIPLLCLFSALMIYSFFKYKDSFYEEEEENIDDSLIFDTEYRNMKFSKSDNIDSDIKIFRTSKKDDIFHKKDYYKPEFKFSNLKHIYGLPVEEGVNVDIFSSTDNLKFIAKDKEYSLDPRHMVNCVYLKDREIINLVQSSTANIKKFEGLKSVILSRPKTHEHYKEDYILAIGYKNQGEKTKYLVFESIIINPKLNDFCRYYRKLIKNRELAKM